jgi:putative acetyltransferase
MNIKIRSESVKDYHPIAEINTLAFSKEGDTGNIGKSEMTLVDVLRHGPDFDPDLSLVAEVDGRVVGHALFYPYKVFVLGEEMAAVSLHPIAVAPLFQRRGIGGALMNEAHRRLAEKGYIFSFLYGHPDYYPLFGYRRDMFGGCHVEIERKHIPDVSRNIEERQLEPADVEQVVAMWKIWFMDVPLAIFPGASFVDWVAHFEGWATSVIFIKGELGGFLRYHTNEPGKIRFFLAKDKAATAQLLGYLNRKYHCHDVQSLQIPVHPETAATKDWLPCPFTGKAETWDAGMIKIFDESNETIRAYCDNVAAGKQKPGILIYPPYLDEAW